MQKPQNIKKLVKLQAYIRGNLSRDKNRKIVNKIKANAPKKTKKYQQISKLQAHIKGFLFRVRRKRLLQKLADKNSQSKTSLFEGEGEDDEFDAEAFFGIKEEALESNAKEEDDLMLKAIQMMAAGNQISSRPPTIPTEKPPLSGKKTNQKISELPDIQTRTLTNMKQQSGFSSARRKDSISELDLSSVKHAEDKRGTGKRQSVPRSKFNHDGNQTNNMFPDIVN